MKIVKGQLQEGISSLEQMMKRLEIYSEELCQLKQKVAYEDGSYDIVEHISAGITNLYIQQQNIRKVIEAIRMSLSYYQRCEDENVQQIYEEKIDYKERLSGEIELRQIKDILSKMIGG